MSDRRVLLRWVLAAAIGLLLALAWSHVHEAPDPSAPDTVPAAPADAPAAVLQGIDWFAGSVDEAFARAAIEDKPVLLYWGAEWCPPCNQLKSTVFRRPDFIARTREFVAVYIDGDEAGAQALQDRFHAMGYPTLILFDPRGTEITRIPGGMDLARYMDVLDLALEAVRPVAELVDRVVAQGGTATPSEWRLLSAYSWFQDAGRALVDRPAHAVLRELATRAPAEPVAVRAALVADYLDVLWRLDPPPDAATRNEALALLQALLGSAEASAAVRSFLGLGAGDAIEHLTTTEPAARAALLPLWEQRLAEAMPAAQSPAERIWLLHGEVGLARLRGALDDALRGRVRAVVDAEVAAATDVYTRSAVLNAAIGTLDAAGLGPHAMELLQVQLEDPHFGFYWMLDLAALAEASGDTEAAIAWLQQAVDGAEGRATRIQWGSVQVAGLVRMAPRDSERIRAALDGVLEDVGSQPQALHGRNRVALERMRAALRPWAEGGPARGAVLSAARARLGAQCEREFASEEAQLEACAALL